MPTKKYNIQTFTFHYGTTSIRPLIRLGILLVNNTHFAGSEFSMNSFFTYIY